MVKKIALKFFLVAVAWIIAVPIMISLSSSGYSTMAILAVAAIPLSIQYLW